MLARTKARSSVLIFTLLYLCYLAGMIYSHDSQYGWFDLEVKLALILFPIILATADEDAFSGGFFKRILTSYVAGCFMGSLLLFGHAVFQYLEYNLQDPFYYSNLSWYFHSSYLSMYYDLAIAIIAYYLVSRTRVLSVLLKITGIFLLVYFLVLVFLLSSKAGILVLFILMVYFTILIIWKKKMVLNGILFFFISATVFYTTYRIFPYAFKRMENLEKVLNTDTKNLAQTRESTAERMTIWKASSEIIRDHLFFGVGTGDVKDELLKKYKEKGMGPALEQKLNAHNQYLQTFVALGLLGIFIFLSLILVPAWEAVTKGYYLYFAFILIFALNIFVESMFEVQAGIIFYAFFNSFFFLNRKKEQAFMNKTIENSSVIA